MANSTMKMATVKPAMKVGYANLTPQLSIPGKLKGASVIAKTSGMRKGIPGILRSRFGKKMTSNKIMKGPGLNTKIKV